MTEKGKVSAISDGGKKVTVIPAFSRDVVSHELVVPFFLYGCLEVNMEVVYCCFPDNTGVVLARMDGEWNHEVRDGVEIVTGDVTITAGDMATGQVPSYNGHTHEYSHGGTSTGPDTTKPPQ